MVSFWVLVKDLPHGFVSGNFVGEFIQYDSQAISLGYTGVLRMRARVDVRKPLRIKKKIVLSNGSFHYVGFTYEKLMIFCFICEKLGHGKAFCPLSILQEDQEFVFGWNLSLRAPNRLSIIPTSRWLKKE